MRISNYQKRQSEDMKIKLKELEACLNSEDQRPMSHVTNNVVTAKNHYDT